MRGAFFSSLLFLYFLTGCAAIQETLSPVAPKTPEMEKGFQQAESFFYARRLTEAKQAYETFLDQFPYNSLTPKTYFRLGEIHFHEKDFKQAVSFYRKSVAKGVDPQWGAAALYKTAVCYSRMDQPKKILATLDHLPADFGDAKVALKAGSLRVSTAKKMEDPLEEKKGYLELIDAYEAVSPSDTKIGELNWIVSEKTAREEIREWVEKEEDEESINALGRLKGWMDRFQGKTSGAYLSWKISRLYHQKGEYDKAADWANRYLQGYPKHDYASAARSLVAEVGKRGEVSQPAAVRSFVGVLLPLSGKFAVYGESVLHGLECAAGVFAPCQGDLGLNLLIRDTGGDPKKAARILEEFSRRPEVRAVIGPLPQLEVDEAVAVAEQAGLPMITLSQKPDVAREGDFIFRNFLTAADQAATLVDYACGEKRWKRLAILYPQGAGGEEYRREFEEAVDRCGGKVVAKASYSSGTRGMTEGLRMLKFSSSSQRGDRPVSFEALFFPDLYRRVPELLAALKFLGIEGVHLLGGAGWDNPALVRGESAADLEGAVFVDGFFAKGSGYAARDFVATFQSAFGMEPTLLEAYAYDTLRLLGEVLRDSPTADRIGIQKGLERKRNFSGVTGSISFDEEGDARRRLTILTVENGEIREVP